MLLNTATNHVSYSISEMRTIVKKLWTIREDARDRGQPDTVIGINQLAGILQVDLPRKDSEAN